MNEKQIIDFASWLQNIKKEEREDFARFFSEINSRNIGDFVRLLPVLKPEDRNDFIMLYEEGCIAGKFCKPSCYDRGNKYSETLHYFFKLFSYMDKQNRKNFVIFFKYLHVDSNVYFFSNLL